MYARDGQLGDLGNIFDAVKSIVNTVAKGVRVVSQGVTATIHPPGLPPIMINLTDPNVLKKAAAAASAIVRNTTLSSGRPEDQPNPLASAASSAGAFLTSPMGLALVVGGGLLLLSGSRRRGRA